MPSRSAKRCVRPARNVRSANRHADAALHVEATMRSCSICAVRSAMTSPSVARPTNIGTLPRCSLTNAHAVSSVVDAEHEFFSRASVGL